jgi:hypothetical protein
MLAENACLCEASLLCAIVVLGCLNRYFAYDDVRLSGIDKIRSGYLKLIGRKLSHWYDLGKKNC